jgi:hypothetical protein
MPQVKSKCITKYRTKDTHIRHCAHCPWLPTRLAPWWSLYIDVEKRSSLVIDTSHKPTRCVRNYIKNELFLVEDSLSHILTVNKFHLSKTIRMREKTCDRELRNTTPKYQNASTQSRAIKNTKTHKPRAKLQEMI